MFWADKGALAMALRSENVKMVGKLAVITVGMFAFGYALIPLYLFIF